MNCQNYCYIYKLHLDRAMYVMSSYHFKLQLYETFSCLATTVYIFKNLYHQAYEPKDKNKIKTILNQFMKGLL